MKRLAFLAALLLPFSLSSPLEGGGGGPGRPAGRVAFPLPYVPGEILVKYRGSVSTLKVENKVYRIGARIKRRYARPGILRVGLPPGMSVEEALGQLASDPDVDYAEPNYIYSVASTTPNDPDFARLWGLHNTGQSVNGTGGTTDADIDAPEAWDIQTGSADVIVAVIDTGVDYDHPDLASNIWQNPDETPNDGIDNDGNGYTDDVVGWDFMDDDDDPMDPHGHGTHVAGTIAAEGDNGTGIVGVCWNAKIMPLKAANAFGQLTVSAAAAAIDYAIDKGARVINASWGGGGFSQTLHDAISSAKDSGILFIAAAGNNYGNDNDTNPIYPASYDLANIIAVASTDQDDALSSFSNFGAASVDVAAPGENIYSAQPGRQTVWADNFEDGDINDWTVDAPWNIESNGTWTLSDSPGADYGNGADISARPTAPIDLSGASGAILTFRFQGASESGDSLFVETSTDGASWTARNILIDSNLVPSTSIWGTYTQWTDATVDLGPLDGESTVYFRFHFITDASGTADGWYIDNLAVTASDIQDNYQFLQGTSMATPHVSGLAALVWSDDGSLSWQEVKNRILNGVDRKAGLAGKVLTGGRINADKTLQNFLPPPSGLSAGAASNTQIDLSWSDNSYGESGFRIERKAGASGTYAEIATVAGDATTFSDTGLATSTTYYYRVKAYGTANESDYSNEASATTAVPPPSDGGGGGSGCFLTAVAR